MNTMNAITTTDIAMTTRIRAVESAPMADRPGLLIWRRRWSEEKATAGPVPRVLELRVGALSDPSLADNLVELFKEITDLGTIEPLDAGRHADGMRRFKVVTASDDSELLDLFSFHVAREQVKLQPLTTESIPPKVRTF